MKNFEYLTTRLLKLYKHLEKVQHQFVNETDVEKKAFFAREVRRTNESINELKLHLPAK